ncbi:MAG: hypothetical protein RL238_1958 [Actinomycetota bacterium]
MMHEAHRHPTGNPTLPAALPASGLVLRGTHSTVRVRQWPAAPTTALLVMYQQTLPPTTDDLERWCDELRQRGFRTVRTSALANAASVRVESIGFHVVQRLVLLEHHQPAAAPAPTVATSRLLVGHDLAASTVDRAAFGAEWALDPAAVGDVRHATPRHRARATLDAGDAVTAYAITGRDARLGFLQRLAVHPDQQRQGLGLALVHDSLRWLARWRVQRVLVNTPVDNEPALALYERTGFERLPDGLRVYERSLT